MMSLSMARRGGSSTRVSRHWPRRYSGTPGHQLPTTMVQGSHGRTFGEIERHGKGDACIVLNVGGKEFYTLRSTVAENPVLADHVARAEANQEIVRNGAVFIDRDPSHFGFILQYLRNRVELLSYGRTTVSLRKNTQNYVQLPEDHKVLSEVFVEASYFRITELQEKLCDQSVLANATRFFNKGINPFEAASKMAARLRGLVLAVGGIAGTTTVATLAEFEKMSQWLGLSSKSKGDDEEDPILD